MLDRIEGTRSIYAWPKTPKIGHHIRCPHYGSQGDAVVVVFCFVRTRDRMLFIHTVDILGLEMLSRSVAKDSSEKAFAS